MRGRETGDRLGFVFIVNFYNDRRHELDGESDNVNPGPISELRGLIRTPPYSQRSWGDAPSRFGSWTLYSRTARTFEAFSRLPLSPSISVTHSPLQLIVPYTSLCFSFFINAFFWAYYKSKVESLLLVILSHSDEIQLKVTRLNRKFSCRFVFHISPRPSRSELQFRLIHFYGRQKNAAKEGTFIGLEMLIIDEQVCDFNPKFSSPNQYYKPWIIYLLTEHKSTMMHGSVPSSSVQILASNHERFTAFVDWKVISMVSCICIYIIFEFYCSSAF